MIRVGIVANPASAKDVRRLTGLARVIDVEEKSNLVARLLVGLGPDCQVLALDDPSGVVRRAAGLAGDAGARVSYLDIEIEGSEQDTRTAAAILSTSEVGALVTVGGDGTVRAAAEGWRQAPLVPIAAGTNNAFALTDEPTVIGMALREALTHRPEAFVPTTAIEAETTGGWALAVIDAVVVSDRWVGAGAIWEPGHLVEGFVTIARRTAVGIASISAAFGRLPAGHARHLVFGGSQGVRSVFGPGVVLSVPVADHTDLPIGSVATLDQSGGLVALDGERRLPAPGATIRVVAGPRVLDLEQAFSA